MSSQLFTVLAVLEESDIELPAPLTHDERISRSVEGWAPNEHGHGSIFETQGRART